MKTAEIKTEKGTMKVEFYEKDAPNTVDNFVKEEKVFENVVGQDSLTRFDRPKQSRNRNNRKKNKAKRTRGNANNNNRSTSNNNNNNNNRNKTGNANTSKNKRRRNNPKKQQDNG